MKSQARVSWMVLAVAMLATAVVVGQSFAADEKEADKPAAKEAGKKEKADPRGPLPVYYRDVIDGIQREKIYAIQESYAPKIKELQAQIKALEEKRNAEIEALLRPDQKERVAALMKEAKARQETKGDAKKEPKKEGDAK